MVADLDKDTAQMHAYALRYLSQPQRLRIPELDSRLIPLFANERIEYIGVFVCLYCGTRTQAEHNCRNCGAPT